MHRFWLIVWVMASLVVGMVAGIGLTYSTVIVPRSAELERMRESSSLLRGINLQSIIQSAAPVASWRIKERKNEPSYGPNNLMWSRTCFAEASIPASEQNNYLTSLQNNLQSQVGTSATIYGSSTSSTQGGTTFWRTATLSYMAQGRPGVIEIHAWGTGDELKVFLLIQER